MDWGERLTSDDEDGRLAALRALQDHGAEASQWLSSILDHLSGLEIESREWGATWRAAARVAATEGGARVIRERLGGATRDVEIRALLMVVMNLPQDLWPSGNDILQRASFGDATTQGIALQLAVSVLPTSDVLDPIMKACSSTDPALRVRGYHALVLGMGSDVGLLGDPSVLAALTRAVVEGTEDLRFEIVQRLAMPPLHAGAEEILASALGAPRGAARGKAALALLSSSRHRDLAARTIALLIANDDETELCRCDVMDDLPPEARDVPEIASALRKALEALSANVRGSAEQALHVG